MSPGKPEQTSSSKAWAGELRKYKVTSESLGSTETSFNVFLPPGANFAPVLYYLAVTCNEDTGAQKGGFLRDAAEHGIALVFPDTSPRGASIEGEEEDWDLGTGAAFYIDATSEKWSKHYNMRSFVTEELPQLLRSIGLPLDLSRSSIFGHSMGGHGALSIYLSDPKAYRSASAFAPICNPTKCPWGDKAFKAYLSGGLKEGENFDAVELLFRGAGKGDRLAILVDSGVADNFYSQGQLLPENLREAVKKVEKEEEVQIRLREGYDHSYWFIQTFGPEHIAFHAKHLKA